MSAPPSKKAHLALETPEPSSSSSSSSESDLDEINEVEEDEHVGQEVQVEFEARTFVPSDFQGVLHHVEVLFSLGGMDPKGGVTGGVALRDVTDFIIRQRSVGSAITQSVNVDEEDEDDEDDGLEDLTSVYGVTSVIQLVGGEQEPVHRSIAEDIRSFLLNCCNEKDRSTLKDILEKKGNCVGLLISERIINIPPQISIPLYETLFMEIMKAKAKNLPFNFTHLLLISRRHKLKGAAAMNGSNQQSAAPEQSYVNVEEEILEENADMTFEVKIDQKKAKQDKSNGEGSSSSQGFVDLSQSEYEMSANILVFSANKSELLIDALKREFPLPP